MMDQLSFLRPFLLLFFITSLLSGCASLPARPDIPYEAAFAPAESGLIAALSDRFSAEHGPDRSGFHLLIEAREALESRLALIDSATRSIDVQYFLWNGDEVGQLLFDRLLQAADRGVRVRIIVDDIWLGSSTRQLAALNAHPNLEIRVFNPNPSRDYLLWGALNYLASFRELNRRMHNKLMIVDNHVLLAGGRNIGNEYFGIGEKFNFIDLDVLAVGAVVGESSAAFDHYWNDEVVYPVSGWKVQLPAGTMAEVREVMSAYLEKDREKLAPFAIDRRDWQTFIDAIAVSLIPGEAHFLQDNPVEIDGRDYRLVDMISYIADPTKEELILVSPYLIPVDRSLTEIKQMNADGARVRLLTNSLASTNHTFVNSHYGKYRLRILQSGSELYEFRSRPDDNIRALVDLGAEPAPFISLHAKAIVSDRRKCFIGSLNFDPRAIVINSENGVLIESPELAADLAGFLEELMEPENAWQLSIDDENKIEWKSADRVLSAQPTRGLLQSLVDFFGRFLPIESQL
jgi:cardiolipin synthase C